MSVAASNRRERVRHVDGTRTDLPGGSPATGLSAIAACATGVSTLSGAARAAVYTDPMTPHVEAVVGFQSFRDAPAEMTPTLTVEDPGAAYVDVSTPAGGWTLHDRRDNAPWAAFVLDRDKLDDPGAQLGPAADTPESEAQRPFTRRPLVPLARLIANPFALPGDTAWTLTGAPTDWNDAGNPSMTSSLDGWSATAGVASRPTTGGVDAGPHLRLTVSGAPGYLTAQTTPIGVVPPGGVVSLRVALRGSVAGARGRMIVDLAGDTGTTSAVAQGLVSLTTSWQTVTLDGVTNTSSEPRAVRVRVDAASSSDSVLPVGTTFDVDQLKVKAGAATAGSYVDGASSNGVWYGTAHLSPSYVQTVPAGAYSRPVVAGAPSLTTGDALNVHRRTGALSVGQRLSSPAGVARYRLPLGRTFTVAGWVACTIPPGLPPVLRWVVDIVDGTTAGVDGVRVVTLRSEPFAPSPDAWRRVASTLVLPSLPGVFSARANVMRAHLEVVDPRAGTDPGTTLSTRGVHVYAGPDRGDAAGLLAVPVVSPLLARVTWAPGTESARFPVTRVDVHGNDRTSMVTAASVNLTDAANGTHRWAGDSPGRLTVRGDEVPACKAVDVTIEETNAGPGGNVSVQSLQAWHEVDATGDVESVTVDRSSDADPSSSTVPIGNYAASVVDLVLDDTDGRFALYGRAHIDLGHRIEVAGGVVYTNRSPDPQAVDAYAAGTAGTATWPVTLDGVCPVAAPVIDAHGQVPPAAFVGSSAGSAIYDAPQVTTAPIGEGWLVRARVWVRWETSQAPRLRFAGAFQAPRSGGGWLVSVIPSGSREVIPTGAAGTWWLVDLGQVVIPAGANVAAITAQSQVSESKLVQIGAPVFERLDGAENALTNAVVDPYAIAAASDTLGRWNARGFGTGGNGTHTRLVGQVDGPTLPDGRSLTAYLRKAWTTASSSGGDIGYNLSPTWGTAVARGFPVTPGQTVSAGVLGRRSWTGSAWRAQLVFRDAAGAYLPPTVAGASVTAAASTWRWVEVSGVAPAGAAVVDVLYEVNYPTAVIPVGATHDVAAGYVTTGPAGFVAGDAAGAAWTGVADGSSSYLPAGDGELVEVVETTPLGVFESTSWSVDAPGRSVAVHGIDVLAARAGDDVTQGVRKDTTAEAELIAASRRYLDLGTDQIVTAAQATALPYAIPSETVGTYLADLAKAAVLTAFTDGLGRFVNLPRQDVGSVVDVEVRDSRSLVAASSAITPDVVRNDVRVTVHPITASAVTVDLASVGRDATPTLPWVYAPDPADLLIAPGETVELILEHDPADEEAWSVALLEMTPVIVPGVTVSAWTAPLPGVFDVTWETFAGFARLTVANAAGNPYPLRLVRAWGTGKPLTVADVTQRFTRMSSIDAFGAHPVAVDVRLAQAPTLAAAVGLDVLDNFSLRDDTGERWLPDLSVEMLGDPWRELGDRVVVVERGAGITGEFRVVSHRYEVGVGAASALYLRRVPTGVTWFVLDSSALDGPAVLTY